MGHARAILCGYGQVVEGGFNKTQRSTDLQTHMVNGHAVEESAYEEPVLVSLAPRQKHLDM
jgi:hypothetical protein